MGLGSEEESLVQHYGAGFITETKIGTKYLNKSHCYYLPEQNLWAEFIVDYHGVSAEQKKEIAEIFISKERLCDKVYVPTSPLGAFVTFKNVRIGAWEEEVLRVYGQPLGIVDTVERERRDPSFKESRQASKFGEKVLKFVKKEKGGLIYEFFIKEGRVYSIWIGLEGE